MLRVIFGKLQTIRGALRCPGARDWARGEGAMGEMGSHASRVLVVEDEFLISDMVAEVLAEHGFEVHVAANAKDALQHLTCGAPCDVLFTDINLPGGVDGATLAQLARELRPESAGGLCLGLGQRRSSSSTRCRARPSCPSPTIPTRSARCCAELAHAHAATSLVALAR